MIIEISIREDQLVLPVIKGKMLALQSSFYVHATLKGKLQPIDRHIYIMLAGQQRRHFKTDLMSGPEKLMQELELKREDYPLATIPHDWMYAFATVSDVDGNDIRITRDEADILMMQILRFLDCPEWKIYEMYTFLHKWAWVAWYRHRILGFFHVKGHTC